MVVSKRSLLARAVSLCGIDVCLRLTPLWKGMVCLGYHRVGLPEECQGDRGVFSAAPDSFEYQVQFVKKHYDVIAISDLPDALRRRGRYVLITFDDGYRDNYENAFPILKSHGVPAAFFVSTGSVDGKCTAWWDEVAWMIRSSPRNQIDVHCLGSPVRLDKENREPAIQEVLRLCKMTAKSECTGLLDELADTAGIERHLDTSDDYMTWDMLREMRNAGMTIGGHGVSHRILGHLDRESQEAEIRGCAERFLEEMGMTMKYFSYPEGSPVSFNAETRVCLSDMGIEYAFSLGGRYQRFDDWDPHNIRRQTVLTLTSRELFSAMLAMPFIFN